MILWFGNADVVQVAEVSQFDFSAYMQERAKLVEEALDAACPARYPETVTDAMR